MIEDVIQAVGNFGDHEGAHETAVRKPPYYKGADWAARSLGYDQE